jgi:hypothetical protein
MVVAAAILLVLGVGHSVRAQDLGLPSVTATYALENARVVQAPGHVLDSATVLIREGIIEAVGTDVEIPYDARRIEADTLTVYPGFIDGLSHAGVEMPEDGEEKEIEDPGDPPPGRAGIQPDRSVRPLLNADASTLDSLRRLGFTAGHVVPEGGMLPGSGAYILYGGEETDEMVLETKQTLFAQIEGAPARAYPPRRRATVSPARQTTRCATSTICARISATTRRTCSVSMAMPKCWRIFSSWMLPASAASRRFRWWIPAAWRVVSARWAIARLPR